MLETLNPFAPLATLSPHIIQLEVQLVLGKVSLDNPSRGLTRTDYVLFLGHVLFIKRDSYIVQEAVG